MEESIGEPPGERIVDEGVARGDDFESPPDCSGTFAEPEVVFEEIGWIAQALTPSADGLEFFYARLAVDPSLDDSGTRLPSLRTRATVDSPFGEPVVLWTLTEACESVRPGTELAALDLSHDGLRLYMGCSDFLSREGTSGPLLVFEREESGAPFERSPRVIGEVGISLGLTRDELMAFGTSLDPGLEGVLWYERDSIRESFSPAQLAGVAMSNPEPAPDGQVLWGVVPVVGTSSSEVAFSAWNRGDRRYEAPVPAGFSPPTGASDVSPALTGDCRSLYFSRYSYSPQTSSKVMIARR